MANCDLSIELDEPDRIYRGGEKVRGSVNVETDTSVNCKALEVQSGWRTHGRGNVAKGTAEKVTLFSGQWEPGRREAYRFELTVADWPPSYHGSYINVDHYIDVRVKIPWAFDPKASAEYIVRPHKRPETIKNQSTELTGCIGNAVAAIVILALIAAFGGMIAALIANPFAGLFIGVFIVPLSALLAAKTVLPKFLLGNVESELMTPEVHPGGTVKVKLGFQPKRRVNINRITATLNGSEVAVSGSGSNRTTHRKQFYQTEVELLGTTVIEPGDQQAFSFDIPVPSDAPYSFDLADNDLKWTVDLRVDIPRWPDWTKSLAFDVFPDQDAAPEEADRARLAPMDHADGSSLEQTGQQEIESEITFVETASHLWDSRGDDQRIDLLIDAVSGMTFDMDVFIERRLLYSGKEDPHVYDDGYAVWARHDEPPLPLVLYIPRHLADEYEQAGRDRLTIRGAVVGWDHDHERLQVKVLP
ncbi:sporulation protein [Roseiconus lacunae]|uniref:sporulation protein n=1 Tax=Roseiconus lacunae TaxID=2605694 RepID=UPI001E4C36CB|nr:sporulation protein [Roseiconus lacunae]MCD0463600.1 sporulation protein [Roseiconus lacunae]